MVTFSAPTSDASRVRSARCTGGQREQRHVLITLSSPEHEAVRDGAKLDAERLGGQCGGAHLVVEDADPLGRVDQAGLAQRGRGLADRWVIECGSPGHQITSLNMAAPQIRPGVEPGGGGS
jgi:hypothetical protein